MPHRQGPIAKKMTLSLSEQPLPILPHGFLAAGAPVPEGADSVVQVEDTEVVALGAQPGALKRVRILKAAVKGQDIRPVGSDIM
jgi:hypothetical protein